MVFDQERLGELTVCHDFLNDASLYQFLTRVDQSIADAIQAKGCGCGAAASCPTRRIGGSWFSGKRFSAPVIELPGDGKTVTGPK